MPKGNYVEEEQKFTIPAEFIKEDVEILISNYDRTEVGSDVILKAYETFAVKVK